MPELSFAVEGAEAVPYCAAPTLGVRLRVTNRTADPVRAVALDCQVRIDAQRRPYGGAERGRLDDLFGEPSRWSRTLRSLLWAQAHVSVPPFTDSVEVRLPVPCTADFNEQAGRYFHALEGGVVPLTLLFSGTVFADAETGALTVTRVPWEAEAAFDLPVSTWRDVIDRYYPNSGWLTLRRDTFDRLREFRARGGLATWDQALDALLDAAAEEARP